MLRTWEARHGFPGRTGSRAGTAATTSPPSPSSSALRRRDAGIRLEVAIAEAAASTAPETLGVRGASPPTPALAPQRLRKSTLLALSWALEDECCARAESPMLWGAFQEQRFWLPSATRWNEPARVARSTMVLADFDRVANAGAPRRPTQVLLAEDAPMRREWAIVCDAVDLPACLAAWELPGQTTVADRDRIFEAVWTIEPQAVRDAARVCAQVAERRGERGSPAALRAGGRSCPSSARRGGGDCPVQPRGRLRGPARRLSPRPPRVRGDLGTAAADGHVAPAATPAPVQEEPAAHRPRDRLTASTSGEVSSCAPAHPTASTGWSSPASSPTVQRAGPAAVGTTAARAPALRATSVTAARLSASEWSRSAA